jgi:GAF domain-containing protein
LSALLQDYVRSATQFGDIVRAIVLGHDLDSILRQIVEAGMSFTGAEAGLLLLLDETMRQLQVAVALGQDQHIVGNLAAEAGDERLYPVLQEGAAVRLHSSERCDIEIQTGRSTRAVLQVSLQAQGRVLGLVTVDRWIGVEAFSERDEQMLKILADYVVLAMERAS